MLSRSSVQFKVIEVHDERNSVTLKLLIKSHRKVKSTCTMNTIEKGLYNQLRGDSKRVPSAIQYKEVDRNLSHSPMLVKIKLYSDALEKGVETGSRRKTLKRMNQVKDNRQKVE